MKFKTFQAGGRKNTQPAEPLMVPRLRINQQSCIDIPMHFLKVDLSSAFDKVGHSVLVDALLQYEVLPELVMAMTRCLTNSSVTLKAKQMSATVNATNGVRRGLSDSAWMFVLVLDFVMAPLVRKWTECGYGMLGGGVLRIFLSFADDIILIATDLAHIRIMYAETVVALAVVGLMVNKNKLKWSTNEFEMRNQLFDGVVFALADKILFLGCCIGLIGNRGMAALEYGIRESWKLFHGNTNLLCHARACLGKRINVWARTTMTSLTWSAETWLLNKDVMNRADAVCCEMFAQIVGISKQEKHVMGQEHRQRLAE